MRVTGAGVGLAHGQAGLVDQEGREGAVNHLQHGREQLSVGSRTDAAAGWEDETVVMVHPLAYGHMGDHLTQPDGPRMGRGLGHTAGATRRAKPAAFT